MSNISGRFLDEWQAQGGASGKLGAPVSNIVNVAQGQAVYFERGCLYSGTDTGGGMLTCLLNLPKLGCPKVFRRNDGAEMQMPGSVRTRYSKTWVWSESARTLGALWGDRLYLQAVTPDGVMHGRIPTYVYQTRDSEYSATEEYVIVDMTIDPTRTGAAPLTNRTLYDIVLVPPGESGAVVAPHALYSKDSWDNFGLFHITDLHISKRNDRFRDQLTALGETEGAAALSNPNDNFREMIRYANHLHEVGLLDGVVATGDLVDYIFEEDGYDNFLLLERLIRGQAATATSSNPPLCVPIYTVLGNHDYHPNHYDLCFWVDFQFPIPNKNIDLFQGFNLTETEAIKLQGESSRPRRSAGQALDMLQTDTTIGRGRGASLTNYRLRINDKPSYIAPLGKHRLVMLDTGEDLGIPSSADFETQAALVIELLIGGLSENELRAVNGAPNAEGISREGFQLVNEALRESDGLVILGMHAPLIHPEGSEYAHYFRETEHPSIDPAQVRAFLSRHGGDSGEREALWPPNSTTFFKRGGRDPLLKSGVAEYRADDLLQLADCGGNSAGRPIDLILAGHHHDNVEYRLHWNTAQGTLEFSTDFYSENPSRYYACRQAGVDGPVHQIVRAGAPINGGVGFIRDHRGGQEVSYQVIGIPPNPDPLRDSWNPAQWWHVHRPLLIETASLGQIDSYQRVPAPAVPFQGFRFLMARGNVLTRIHNVDLATLRAQGTPMQWESEVLPPHAAHEHPHDHVFGETGEHHHHDHAHPHPAGATHHHPLPGETEQPHHEHAHPHPHDPGPDHHHPHQHPHPAGKTHHHPY